MNWYLITVLALFAISHAYSVYKAARDGTTMEASVTAVVLSIFWWLFYMAGIFTLL